MVLALDVGSRYSKGLLFDSQVVERVVVRTSLKPLQAIEELEHELSGYDWIVATGKTWCL